MWDQPSGELPPVATMSINSLAETDCNSASAIPQIRMAIPTLAKNVLEREYGTLFRRGRKYYFTGTASYVVEITSLNYV